MLWVPWNKPKGSRRALVDCLLGTSDPILVLIVLRQRMGLALHWDARALRRAMPLATDELERMGRAEALRTFYDVN